MINITLTKQNQIIYNNLFITGIFLNIEITRPDKKIAIESKTIRPIKLLNSKITFINSKL